MPRKLKPGKACPECQEPMVVITQNTLHRILELSPAIRSIPAVTLREARTHYHICKRCDGYALGDPLWEGFPYEDVDGVIREIHGKVFAPADMPVTKQKRRRGTVIIELADGILLTQMRGDRLLLPGGQAERREPRIMTAIRELYEETGLVAESVRYLFDFESSYYHHKVFYVTASGKPQPRSEVANLAYYRPDMPELSASSRAIIEKFLLVTQFGVG